MPYANNQTRENIANFTPASSISTMRNSGGEPVNFAFLDNETASFLVPSFMMPLSTVSFSTESEIEEEKSFNAAKYLGLTALAVALIALMLFVWNEGVEKHDLHVQTETIAMH